MTFFTDSSSMVARCYFLVQFRAIETQKVVDYGVFEKGSNGNRVKDAQTAMNEFGVKPKLEVVGIFGPRTEAVVRCVQKKLELKADGIAGEMTLAAV